MSEEHTKIKGSKPGPKNSPGFLPHEGRFSTGTQPCALAQGPCCFLLEKAPGIKIAKQQAAPSGAQRPEGRDGRRGPWLPGACVLEKQEEEGRLCNLGSEGEVGIGGFLVKRRKKWSYQGSPNNGWVRTPQMHGATESHRNGLGSKKSKGQG